MLNKTGCTQSNLAQQTEYHLTMKTKLLWARACPDIKITLAVGYRRFDQRIYLVNKYNVRVYLKKSDH